MSRRLIFRSAALEEMQNSVAYYETESPGVGRRFAAEVARVIDAAMDQPKRYPLVYARKVREAPLVGFPFCIYYTATDDFFSVLSVYHQSRKPGGWHDRV